MSRESSTALASRYGDHGPIALDSLRPGDHSYTNALDVIDERVEVIQDLYQRQLAHGALMSLVLRQAARNQGRFSATRLGLSDEEISQHDEVIGGHADAPDYIRFLNRYPQQLAVEDARLIHPNDWDVRDFIDTPVRDSLIDASAELDTELSTEKSHYKIAQFSDSLSEDIPLSIVVDRKRIVMSHFGGSILTVVRNSLLVDTRLAPESLREHIFDEQAARARLEEERGTYDYDQHSTVIEGELEDYLRARNLADKPEGVIPLMTTYYSALKSEIQKD